MPTGFGGAGGSSTGGGTTTGGFVSTTTSATGASGSGASVGSAGFGFTIVAAGRTSTGAASSSPVAFFRGCATFFSSPSASPSAGAAVFARAGRLGLGSSGRSRPLPSLTRSALASVVSRGVMARTPLVPISSAASMRSLLVTPSSLASSMTFIFVAATAPSPPGNPSRQAFASFTWLPECLRQAPALERAPDTLFTRTHVRAASGPAPIHLDPPIRPPDESHQVRLRLHLPATDARAPRDRACAHSGSAPPSGRPSLACAVVHSSAAV